MKKTREQKGITLVVLVITIIVLLILAVVAIRAIQESEIIGYAKKSTEDYEEAKGNEQIRLDSYVEKIEKYVPTVWKDNGDFTYTSNKGDTINVGDKVAYDEGYDAENLRTSDIDSNFVMKNLEWRVLGITEDGNLKLISTQPTDSALSVGGESGWLEGEDKLDTLCNDLYGSGIGAKTARSLKVEDIDKLAGIKTDEDKKELSSNYGTVYRVRYDETEKGIKYSILAEDGETWVDCDDTSQTKFIEPGKPEINSKNTKATTEIKATYYEYQVSKYIKSKTFDNISVASLITYGLNDTNSAADTTKKWQWLSSPATNVSIGWCTMYKILSIEDSNLLRSGYPMKYSTGAQYTRSYYVRPVVILNSELNFEKVGDTWQFKGIN